MIAVRKGRNQTIDFAAIVHYHRKQSGLSRIELARLAGIGKTALFELENGKSTVRLDILMKVLSALNIELEWNSPLKDAMMAEDARSGPERPRTRGG